MLKIFLLLCLSFFAYAPMAQADVSFITVNDEESYNEVEDFSNTYEINFNRHGENKINKCQAVRIDKYWFLTAAHCVENACKGNCSFQARLVVGPNYEADMTVTHTPKSPKIFKHPKANVNKHSSAYDLALLYFKPSESKLVYKDLSKRMAITERQFLNRIPNESIYHKAVKGTNIPNLLIMAQKKTAILDRELSIISIWNGEKSVMKNSKDMIFSPSVNLFFTKNFGVKKGISGSGVMSNTGELVGIVSAIGTVGLLNPKTQKYEPTELVYISAFDQSVVDFIHENMGSFGYIESGAEHIKSLTPFQKNFANSITQMQSLKK